VVSPSCCSHASLEGSFGRTGTSIRDGKRMDFENGLKNQIYVAGEREKETWIRI
jgi:hypothetical protein